MRYICICYLVEFLKKWLKETCNYVSLMRSVGAKYVPVEDKLCV